MAKKTNYSVDTKPRSGKYVFRDASSGQFNAKVMSRSAYTSASGKANTAIKEAVKTPASAGPSTKTK